MVKVFNWLKNNIPVIMISVVIAFVLDTMAETNVPSIGVSYNNDKTSETTVNGALNELFSAVDINEEIVDIKADINSLKNTSLTLDKAYPIGSIFISTSATNPGNIIGGTWEKYGVGKTLLSTDGDSEQTGGSNIVTLSTNNLPSHKHSIPALSGTAASAGAHTHTVSGTVSSTFTGSSATTSSVDINHTHDVIGSTGYQSANHTHGIPALSGSTSSAGDHFHGLNGYYGSTYTTIAGGSTYYGSVGGNMHSNTQTTGAHTHSVSTNASTTGSNSASHAHDVAIKSAGMSANNKHTHTVTAKGSVTSTFSNGSAASNGAHTHNVTTTASTSGATGSGTAFSVQNPYITVYMWKRTA